MHNGENHRYTGRGRLVAGVLALAVAGTLVACTPAEKDAAAPAAAPAAKTFGPDGYGELTIGITEKDALATGELQSSPVSTVLGRNVNSFVDGPKPDAARMAKDEEIEKAVAKADSGSSGKSAKELADDTKAYADSTQRLSERLLAYLTAGGATFEKGVLTSIAAPEGAATEAGIKRGSSRADIEAAYRDKGLKSDSETAYLLPLTGHAGWTIRFELEGDTLQYLSMGGPN